MFPKSRQQSWIRGLPGLNKKGGMPLETLPFSTPKPDERSLSMTIYGSSELVSKLQSLSKQRTKLARLSLTVRTDTKKELDNQYLMTGVVIDALAPVGDLAGAQAVTVIYNSLSMRMALTANPGPPMNCPPVQPTGPNTGWIFGLPQEDIKSGIPLEIVDFIPPHYNRRLTMTLGKPSSEIKALFQYPVRMRHLILVLPDHKTQRYVEFKLWNTKAIIVGDERHVAFESDMVLCLTG